MYKASSPRDFPKGTFITWFSEKNYEQSILAAEQFGKAHPNMAELVCYYEQPAFKKSILVAYKRLDNQDDYLG